MACQERQRQKKKIKKKCTTEFIKQVAQDKEYDVFHPFTLESGFWYFTAKNEHLLCGQCY